MNDVGRRLKDLTRPTSEDDILKVNYPTPRFEVAPRAVAMVAVVALMGVVLFAALRLGGQSAGPQPMEMPQLASALGVVETPTDAPQAPPSEIVVAVVGDVANPGLYTFAPGARVAEALVSAGVSEPESHTRAAQAGLNVAEPLSDGSQIYVPFPGESVPQAATAEAVDTGSSSGLINLNTASASELETLDGVGAKTAQLIIAHRESVGGFGSIEQLMEIKGIGPAKFEALKDQVTV